MEKVLLLIERPVKQYISQYYDFLYERYREVVRAGPADPEAPDPAFIKAAAIVKKSLQFKKMRENAALLPGLIEAWDVMKIPEDHATIEIVEKEGGAIREFRFEISEETAAPTYAPAVKKVIQQYLTYVAHFFGELQMRNKDYSVNISELILNLDIEKTELWFREFNRYLRFVEVERTTTAIERIEV